MSTPMFCVDHKQIDVNQLKEKLKGKEPKIFFIGNNNEKYLRKKDSIRTEERISSIFENKKREKENFLTEREPIISEESKLVEKNPKEVSKELDSNNQIGYTIKYHSLNVPIFTSESGKLDFGIITHFSDSKEYLNLYEQRTQEVEELKSSLFTRQHLKMFHCKYFGGNGSKLIHSDKDVKDISFTVKLIEDDTGFLESLAKDYQISNYTSIGDKVKEIFHNVSDALKNLPIPIPFITSAAPIMKPVGLIFSKFIDRVKKDDDVLKLKVDFNEKELPLAEGYYVFVFGIDENDMDYFTNNVFLGENSLVHRLKNNEIQSIIYPHVILSVTPDYTDMTALQIAVNVYKNVTDPKFFGNVLDSIKESRVEDFLLSLQK